MELRLKFVNKTQDFSIFNTARSNLLSSIEYGSKAFITFMDLLPIIYNQLVTWTKQMERMDDKVNILLCHVEYIC